MNVKIARTAGFCWGVRRTVEKVMEVADQRRSPVVTLGPIIHNPQAVARFREKGVGTVNEVGEVADGTTVVVRTHGAVRDELERAEARHLEVVDGTCPYVKYPQAMARQLSGEGYHVVIVGSSSSSLFAYDLRTRPLHICEEIRAGAAEVAAEDVSGQCASAGGTWGFDLCVDTSLTGSCAYSLGPADFERHFYPPGPGYDPVFWCTMSSWDGVHGVWRPAP